ncbi:MAG: TIGR01459 family HAD-type hydrolase [Rickettsiales bacterium]|nr:TIGR01459 family HAD-type hydrolase [Rickettsiales bacterium]
MNFLTIAENYDAFLCDLWGVIHDGDELYDGVLESLEALHAMGKKLLFLSNAPRLAETIFTRMDDMGVKREWYLGGMTSGEGAVKYLQQMPEPFTGKYYYLGLEKDTGMLPLISQTRVGSVDEADFILNGNFEALGQTYPDIQSIVEAAAARKLPMLCINPDMEVTKMDGTQILCAGLIAEKYIELGGQVEYIGKPYPYVFELGMQMLGNPSKDRVLMIGDNVLTDIKGGNVAGIDTVFITQGILQNQKSGEQTAQEYCVERGVTPTHIVKSL